MCTAIVIQKVYPNTNREPLWKQLELLGIDVRLINFLRTLHSVTKYSVRTHTGNNEEIERKRAVREWPNLVDPFSSTTQLFSSWWRER